MHAVIFDIDGTLLQSAAIDDELYQQAVRHLIPDAHIRPAIADYDFVAVGSKLGGLTSFHGLSR